MNFDLEKLHESAIEIARKGGDHTLNYFRKVFDVERKSDDSPVTIADRETEKIMRKAIRDRYPGHGIVGEEFGSEGEESPVQWILDPIDGTKSFIHGVPLYTTLVGVLVEEEPVIGVVYAPALDEMCEAAKGKGTRLNGNKCKVRPCDSISEATFLSTDVRTHHTVDLTGSFEKLLQSTRLHRTWGDAYGHMMVATGRADIMFDPILSIWDAAPLLTIVREAGGIFSDIRGEQTIHTGNGISSGPGIHEHVLAFFK